MRYLDTLNFAGSARPDVVPGSSTLYDDHANAGDQAATNEVASSKYGGKPKHKRQDELQHASYNHSRSVSILTNFILQSVPPDLQSAVCVFK